MMHQNEKWQSYLLWQQSRGVKFPKLVAPANEQTVEPEAKPQLIVVTDIPLNDLEEKLLGKMLNAISLGDHYHLDTLSNREDFIEAGGSKIYDEVGDSFRDRHIELNDSTIVLLLGVYATRAVYGKGSFKQLRGQVHNGMLPTYHPRDLLKYPNLKVEAWQDLQILQKFILS